MEKPSHPRRRPSAPAGNLLGPCAAFLVTTLLLLPRSAVANMGTPLMWASGLHLLFGNAIIGIIEGALLARIWRVKRAWSVPLMVAGNYVAWWGGLVAMSAFARLIDLALGAVPLLHVRRAIALTIAMAFLGSVVVEAPFALAALVRRARRQDFVRLSAARLAFGLIAPQVATYALLVCWYGLASVTSVLHVPVDQRMRAEAPPAWVYFKDASGGAKRILVGDGEAEPASYPEVVEKHHGMQARSLDPSSPWQVSAGGWAAEGIRARHANRMIVRLALETPSISWHAIDATLLPGGYVVFQLGKQIVLLRLERPTLAFLTMGSKPYVELVEQIPGQL